MGNTAVGNIRKMQTELSGEVQYHLPLFDVLAPGPVVFMNELIGQTISIQFAGDIHCVVSGKKIKKTYGDGMSYDAFMRSPMAVESIIRPELSRIHEGIALRDKEWEEAHHNQPHITYIARTGGTKVGVTRSSNIPDRWIDQGAVEAIILAEVPYRQLAGLIEVELRQYISDKTNWRNMLTNKTTDRRSLLEIKDTLIAELPVDYQDFISDNDAITQIHYPVIKYPEKVQSMSLDKNRDIKKGLAGIRGQYLIFDDQTVLNLRSHAGYRISLSW